MPSPTAATPTPGAWVSTYCDPMGRFAVRGSVRCRDGGARVAPRVPLRVDLGANGGCAWGVALTTCPCCGGVCSLQGKTFSSPPRAKTTTNWSPCAPMESRSTIGGHFCLQCLGVPRVDASHNEHLGVSTSADGHALDMCMCACVFECIHAICVCVCRWV